MANRGELPSEQSLLEECVDELDRLVESLNRFPEPVLAQALRIHLSGLLRAMLDAGLCTRAQASQFIRSLETDTLTA